ncbi:Hint domain-containing protein [Methylorubrum podarium]|jgi:Hint domain|uniref:Hint domain-containing protein n=1 Tax=Methylorubrum podarium TaxID=200476 RepID=UPI001EE26A8E|nr:Hint domain-containing protein [Methylorubrum podarium]GJE69880.1 hypothetical protein CHKEEEPN_1411 [Methylorubrum podarium]
MALPIVFNNVTYGVDFLSQDNDGVQSAVFENDGNNDVPYIFNGTISSVGDPVTLTNTATNNQFNLYATNLDNANQIVFSENPDGSGFAILVSNTQVIEGQTETFSENTLGDFTPVCFEAGTTIRTGRGEIAVEDLKVGDFAVTASGTLRPITWIGHREMTAVGATLPSHQQPVRVRAGAFGQGLPARDLILSPGHPVLVGAEADNKGGVLVPIMCLINGTTITREPRAGVTYWHVELDAHDILLAEGLPAESYLDGGDRAFFEGSDHALHNPDFVPVGWNARCRPVAVDGPVVEAERLRLDAVFAGSLSEQCDWQATERALTA